MNSYQPEGGTIITIERNEKRIKKAKENIKNQGKEELIPPYRRRCDRDLKRT